MMRFNERNYRRVKLLRRAQTGLTLLVVSPIIFFHLDFLIFLQSPRTHDFLINGAVSAFYRIRGPLIFALSGWGLGLLARVVLKRPPVTS